MTIIMRPEIPEDRKPGRSKPWVTWKAGAAALYWLRRERRHNYVTIARPPRGLRHDPERTRAKYLSKRSMQDKDRR